MLKNLIKDLVGILKNKNIIIYIGRGDEYDSNFRKI